MSQAYHYPNIQIQKKTNKSFSSPIKEKRSNFTSNLIESKNYRTRKKETVFCLQA
ncbi:hypothetical protein Bca4012_079547 [Brassica carinata]